MIACVLGGVESYTRRFPRDIGRLVRHYMLRIWPGLVAGMLFSSLPGGPG